VRARQQREARRVRRARKHDDAAQRAAAVGERAPERGREGPRELRQREHQRHLGGAQAARREVRREIRDHQPGVDEEREIERAQSP